MHCHRNSSVGANRRYVQTDHQGSVVSIADAAGTPIATNSYDPWGIPASTNIGRFQYTGQAYIPELEMYHYKARIYSPALNRFLQTDPIGYAGGDMNIYAYVGNDPVNGRDPSGLQTKPLSCEGGKDKNGKENYVSASCEGLQGVAGKEGKPKGNDKKKETQETDPCKIVAGQTGKIKFEGSSISLVLGLGLSRTVGSFENVRTGSTGSFTSYGVGVGLSAGVGRTTGYYDSISNFIGYAETAEAGVSLFGSAISLNAFVTTNANNDVTAAGGGLSLGALPLPNWASRVGATATASDTSISDCTVGQRQ